MNICRDCKEKIDHDAGDEFPLGGSVVLGTAGLVGAIVTGSIVVVGLGMIAGAAVDITRCDFCGRESASEEDNYKVLEANEDEGGQYFSPFRPDSSDEQKSDTPKGKRSLLNNLYEQNQKNSEQFQMSPTEAVEPTFLPFDNGDREEREPEERYRYDEYQQKMVRIDEAQDSTEPDFENLTVGEETNNLLDLLESSIESDGDDEKESLDTSFFNLDDGGYTNEEDY